ncbi:Uncharacterised protein [Enterobacter hormaechei]|nr:Uncharacterised protein [Enterobacter hormaechei]
MNLPGQQSPDSTLPSYDVSRSLGLQAGTDIDFKKLAAQLDCTRNFYNVGIIFDDGKQRWLVRPSRRIADVNQSTVSHVVISKIPDAKETSAEKAVVATLTTPSLATEITSTGFRHSATVAGVWRTRRTRPASRARIRVGRADRPALRWHQRSDDVYDWQR